MGLARQDTDVDAFRYNPVLGEIFRCSYFYDDGTEGYYVAEQVSHHPVSPKLKECAFIASLTTLT